MDEYNKFMSEYKKLHAACPKCGSLDHITTLAGYILNMDKKDEYKDKNKCTCNNCSDIHIRHNRVIYTGVVKEIEPKKVDDIPPMAFNQEISIKSTIQNITGINDTAYNILRKELPDVIDSIYDHIMSNPNKYKN